MTGRKGKGNVKITPCMVVVCKAEVMTAYDIREVTVMDSTWKHNITVIHGTIIFNTSFSRARNQVDTFKYLGSNAVSVSGRGGGSEKAVRAKANAVRMRSRGDGVSVRGAI